ncbi:MAG: hypothetical protein WBA53_06065 [Burkholderiaceae bacterium]
MDDVVPAEDEFTVRTQRAVTRGESGFDVRSPVQPPPQHAVAYDQVEVAGRHAAIEPLEPVADMTAAAPAAVHPPRVDRPVLGVTEAPL